METKKTCTILRSDEKLMHGTVTKQLLACFYKKKKISNSPAEPTPLAAETKRTASLMIKTWIHGQLLSLLYSRNKS